MVRHGRRKWVLLLRRGAMIEEPDTRRTLRNCDRLRFSATPQCYASWAAVSLRVRLACHASRAARSSSAVRPVIGPPAVRTQDKVSRAVSESVRTIKPESRAGEVSRVLNPANSGSGSHSGSERGPDQRLISWLSRKARSTQVNAQDEAEGVRAFRQELAARVRWPDTVKISGQTGLRGIHDPAGEIAHVDELDRIIRRSRHEHLAAAIKPRGPIGEPPRRVLRTCNKSGPADKGVLTDRLLARDLGGAIGLLGTVLDLQRRGRTQWSGIRPLPGRAVVGIYAHCRYEGPMLDALLECRDCATHLAGMT